MHLCPGTKTKPSRPHSQPMHAAQRQQPPRPPQSSELQSRIGHFPAAPVLCDSIPLCPDNQRHSTTCKAAAEFGPFTGSWPSPAARERSQTNLLPPISTTGFSALRIRSENGHRFHGGMVLFPIFFTLVIFCIRNYGQHGIRRCW